MNLHGFGPGCVELDRMLAFRDHLRVHDDDRRLYESTKLELAQREWVSGQDYANVEDDVVADIMSRAGHERSEARQMSRGPVFLVYRFARLRERRTAGTRRAGACDSALRGGLSRW